MFIDKDEFMQLMIKKEDLCSELKQYLEDGKSFKMLRHPLIYAVPYHESENAMLNYRLKLKQEELQHHLDRNELALYVFTHERPWRLDAFTKICERLTNEEYWKLLGETWVDSENIWANLKTWKILLTAERPLRQEFMSKQDRKLLDRLPQKLTVYRGCIIGKNHDGLSYTLNRDVAVKLGNRYNKKGDVLKRDIDKNQIFAYIGERDEAEVIIL